MFGMNLRDPLLPKNHSRNSSTTAITGNATATTAANSSNPHLWSFEDFWITSVTVTIATILLPLTAGAILRWSLRSFQRYKIYWRVLLPLVLVAMVIGLNTISALNFGDRYWEGSYFTAINLIIFSCCLGPFSLFKLAAAIRYKRDRFLWISFALLVILTVAFDGTYVGYNEGPEGPDYFPFSERPWILTGIIPPSFLFIVFFWAEIQSGLSLLFRRIPGTKS